MRALSSCMTRAILILLFQSFHLLHDSSVSALPSPTCLDQLRPVRDAEILGALSSTSARTLNGQCDARRAGVRPCKSKYSQTQRASKKKDTTSATLESSVSTSPNSVSDGHDERLHKSGLETTTQTESEASEVAEVASLTKKLLHLSPKDECSSPLHSSWEDSETTRELFMDVQKNRGSVQQPSTPLSGEPTQEAFTTPPLPIVEESQAKSKSSKKQTKQKKSTAKSGKQKPGKITSNIAGETLGLQELTLEEKEVAITDASGGKPTKVRAKSENVLPLPDEKTASLSEKAGAPSTDDVVWPSWEHGVRGKTCRIVVDGNPIALKRPRHRLGGHTYDPNYRDKKMFLMGCEDQLPQEPWEGAMALSLTFELPRPKLHFSKAKKTFGQLKASVPSLPCTVPDLDNLVKFVLDALNEKLYKDDRQICEITARKVYRAAEGFGRTLVEAALL